MKSALTLLSDCDNVGTKPTLMMGHGDVLMWTNFSFKIGVKGATTTLKLTTSLAITLGQISVRLMKAYLLGFQIPNNFMPLKKKLANSAVPK